MHGVVTAPERSVARRVDAVNRVRKIPEGD
jgi:hypothetical protein